jgi:polysaccharide export outer membrane protein
MRRTMIAMLLLAALLCPALPGQQADWNKQIQQRSFLGDTGMQDYRLGPNDLIDVTVYGVDKFTQSVRISLSGQITLPLLGKVQAAGLTGAELEESVARLLVEKKLILDPQVSVYIKEYRSQPVIVLGAVKSPGQYMITQPIKILDALAMAGGLDLAKAAEYALLQRRGVKAAEANTGDPSAAAVPPANGDPDAIRIDLKSLIEGRDPSQNLPVQGGDVIQVPEAELKLYYLIGEVTRPGGYELPKHGSDQLLLSQAIAWAGGTTKNAKQSEGILVRYNNKGNRVQQAVDCSKILKGKQPDFPVQAGDVIFIPSSNVKTFGNAFLLAAPGTAISIATGSIIYRR